MAGERTFTWPEVVSAAQGLGPDAFVACVSPNGAPHLSQVSPGFLGDRLIVSSWADAVKVRHLKDGGPVMLHWIIKEDSNHAALLIRGDAALVADPARSRLLWEDAEFPWPLEDWYSGPDDPNLVWIEVVPTYASYMPESFSMTPERFIWRP